MTAETTPAVRQYQPPKTIREAYERLATTVAPLLPEGMEPKQFVGLVGSCMAKTPQLRQCDPESFVLAVREAAELQLWPGTNAAALSHLVPGKDHGVWKVSFRIGYRGLEELAYRKGWNLVGRVVHKGDRFEVRYGTTPEIIHEPRRSQPVTGAELEYAYAVCWTGRRVLVDVEVLDREQIEARRKAGNAADGNWWKNHYDRMASKSAVRALGMRLPLAPSNQTLAQRGIAVEVGEDPQFSALPEREPSTDAEDQTQDPADGEPEGQQESLV
jgi:recombination protein RecT